MELFHFDIETACNYPNWKTFLSEDERGAKLFESKYHRMNWEEKYSSIEEAYLEQGGIISTYGRIVCISFGFTDNNGENKISSFYGEDEKDIVEHPIGYTSVSKAICKKLEKNILIDDLIMFLDKLGQFINVNYYYKI